MTANGFCVVRGPVVPRTACDYCAGAIWQRLDQLMSAAFAKGLDVDKGLLRFNEMCSCMFPKPFRYGVMQVKCVE